MSMAVAIPELFHLNSGATVPEIEGTVTKVFQRHEGTNTRGPWSLQGIIIQGGGDEIECTLSSMDEVFSDTVGRSLRIVANAGSKGMTGIKAVDDTYDGVTKRKMRITPSAKLLWDGEAAGQQEPAPRQAPAPARSQSPPPSRPSQQSAPSAGGAGVKQQVAKLGELYAICLKAAQHYCPDSDPDSAATTLFIAAERRGLEREIVLQKPARAPTPAPAPAPTPPPPPPPAPVYDEEEEEDDIPF